MLDKIGKKNITLTVAVLVLIAVVTLIVFLATRPGAEGGYDYAPPPPPITPTPAPVDLLNFENVGLTIRTFGNFETAGINLRFDERLYAIENHEFVFRRNVTADIHYREAGTADWFEGHFFSIYDKRGMATSLFNLAPDTEYELRVLVWEDGRLIFDNIDNPATVRTRPEFEIPDWRNGDGWHIVYAHSHGDIQRAIDNAVPGTVILVEPGSDFNHNGTNVAFNMVNRQGTAERPIIIASEGEMATIRGTATIHNANHILVHNLRFTNMGTPQQWTVAHLMRISGTSTHVTISGCYIHDGGAGAHRGAIHVTGATGVTEVHHLFINNNLSNDHHLYADGAWNVNQPERGYYGIFFHDEPNLGGMYTVRNNTFVGFVDAIHSSGYYGREPLLWSTAGLIDHDDFLSVWYIQEIDFYDNIIYAANDDALQTDGHAVNARFFRNIVGSTHTGISNAHLYPGPSFYIENIFTIIDDGGLKTNTAVGAVGPEPGHGEATMNMFVYNNVFIHNLTYQSHNTAVWLDHPGRVAGKTVINNIFVSRDRNREVGGSANTRYNYVNIDANLYYSLTGSQHFRIWDSMDTWNPGFLTWDSFAAYQRENPFGFEQNSLFATTREELGLDLYAAHPDFPRIPWETYPEGVHMLDATLLPTSLAINNGLFIPGISRSATPNIGASHAFNTGPPRPTAPDPLAILQGTATNDTNGDAPAAPGGFVVHYHDTGGTTLLRSDTFEAGETVTVDFTPAPERAHFEFLGWSTQRLSTTPEYSPGATTSFEIQGVVDLFPVWRPTTVFIEWLSVNGVYADVGVPHPDPRQAVPGRVRLTQAQATDVRFFVHQDAPEGEEGDHGFPFSPEYNVAEIQYNLVGHGGMFKVVPFDAGEDLPTNTGIDMPVNWIDASRSNPLTLHDGQFLGIRVNWEDRPEDVRLYYIIFIEII